MFERLRIHRLKLFRLSRLDQQDGLASNDCCPTKKVSYILASISINRIKSIVPTQSTHRSLIDIIRSYLLLRRHHTIDSTIQCDQIHSLFFGHHYDALYYFDSNRDMVLSRARDSQAHLTFLDWNTLLCLRVPRIKASIRQLRFFAPIYSSTTQSVASA
jgi:hypothetical protein